MNTNAPEFITLSCPSCGAKLEIIPGMDRLACAFCGQEHIVKRTNSTVSLSPVVEAIHQVKTGVDKTAAELAIVRLQKEISELQVKRQNIEDSCPPSLNGFYILSIIIGPIITFAYFTKPLGENNGCLLVAGVILSLIGILSIILWWRKKRYWEQETVPRLNTLFEQIAEKQEELERNQKIVKS